jgi:putative hemolysin
VTQEEVETMIAEGTSAGLIEPEEQTMIEEILRLGDRPIRVAMTPRHEVFWIALNDTEETLRNEVRTCPYSRIVVARENDVDNPLGVVHKKDLLTACWTMASSTSSGMCRRPPSFRNRRRC